MFDPLTAIRRLYAEPPDRADGEPAELEPRDRAEVDALAPVKRAIEQLPRQRPDPELVDAIVAGATNAVVRSLYGEPADQPLPPAAAREAAALAPLKSALDQLPPLQPDPEVVDEVVARATFGDVRSLYGDATESRLPPMVAREAAALASVKAALDNLPRQRPDAAIVDRIVTAATVAAAARRRPGRSAAPARPPRRNVRRRVAALIGTAGAVTLFALAVLWTTQPSVPDQATEMQAQVQAPGVSQDQPSAEPEPLTGQQEPAERIAEAAPPSPAPPVRQQSETTQQAAGAQAGATVPPPAPTRQPSATPPSATPPSATPIAPRAAMPPTAAREAALTALPQLTHTRFQAPSVSEGPDVALAALELEDSEEALRLLYLRLEALRSEGIVFDDEAVILGAPARTRPAAASGWMQVRIER